jgi:hypothetical protein
MNYFIYHSIWFSEFSLQFRVPNSAIFLCSSGLQIYNFKFASIYFKNKLVILQNSRVGSQDPLFHLGLCYGISYVTQS